MTNLRDDAATRIAEEVAREFAKPRHDAEPAFEAAAWELGETGDIAGDLRGLLLEAAARGFDAGQRNPA